MNKQAADFEPVAAENIPCMYVYLNSGEIARAKADDIRLRQDELVVLRNNEAVAWFPRRDVFFCSRCLIAQPWLD